MLVNDMKLESRSYMKVTMRKANNEKKLLVERISELKEKKRGGTLTNDEDLELSQKSEDYDKIFGGPC